MARKAKAAAVAEVTPLTGKALLQKLKEIPELPRREKARECGYVSLTKRQSASDRFWQVHERRPRG